MVKVFFHFAVTGFSNTYVVGHDNGGKALLVDPGVMDINLLNVIEKNNYYIEAVLVTNTHEAHIYGIKTLQKIYKADIYCGIDSLYNFQCQLINDGDTVTAGGFDIEVFQVMGHIQESMVYRINKNLLFTGDAIGAGRIGDSPNEYAKRILQQTIHDKILPLDDDIFIFPGHGPPTTLEIEKMYNPSLTHSDSPE